MQRSITTKARLRKPQTGAGFVEYALALALVALVSIVILGLAGVGVQRLYGVAGGSLGARKQASGEIAGQYINITGATCYVVAVGSSYAGGVYAGSGHTGYVLKFDSNVPVAQLNTAGTEQILMLILDASQSDPVFPGHFTYTADFAASPDASLCPRAAVVQSVQGSIAVAPVEIEYH